jgi:23S rRNA (uracil1939-C5)-methyltransferase
VEKLVYGGDGLGRLEGRAVLLPFVLPGEEVRVEALRESPGLIRGRVRELREAAPQRVEAPCPYFGRCGGCHYQHAPYALQLELKRSIVAEVLRRVGKMDPPGEIAVVSGEPWNYRNRSQFHLEGAEIGYREAQSHRLCGVKICPISSPAVNETLAVLRAMIEDSRWPRFLRSLEVFTDESQVQVNVRESARPVARRFFDWCAQRISGWIEGALEYETGGFRFRVGPHSFFQVNRHLVEQLTEAALDGAEGETAADLYAGVGLFSLPLARRFARVTAVESGLGAVRDLRFNAERAGAAVEAEQAPAEAWLEKAGRAPDFVLLDPPRTGLGAGVTRQLARLQAPRVVIVACDPATLARDLAALTAAGYRLERLTLVDLFPQTFHIETIAHLRA